MYICLSMYGNATAREITPCVYVIGYSLKGYNIPSFCVEEMTPFFMYR